MKDQVEFNHLKLKILRNFSGELNTSKHKV